MDDITKLFPLLGGLMALVGGVFSFVNGRLNEAKTTNQRDIVVTLTILSISVIFSLLGALTAWLLFPKIRLWYLLFYLTSFILNLVLFLRQCSPTLRPGEVVLLCFMFSTYSLFFAVAIMADVVVQIVGIMHKQVDIIAQIYKAIGR